MRILVIGGTLFIGRAIVERLAARGYDVTVLHRRDQHDLGPAIHNLTADRSDVATVARLLREQRFDAIVDVAYDWQKGTPANQVEAAARASGTPQRYVFISSIAAYVPGVERRESDPLVPDDSPNPYAQHKAASERALFKLHAESGLPVTTFRPPFVHGPRQPFDREGFFWNRMRDGRPIILPDGGDTPMQWVYVFDLADGVVRAIEVPEAAGQAFNIAHVEPLTQRTFIEALGRVAGMTPKFVSVPRAKIRAAGGQLVGANTYFGDYLDLGGLTSVVDKAQRVLGITPTPLETALRSSFDWYQAQPQRRVDYAFEERLLSM